MLKWVTGVQWSKTPPETTQRKRVNMWERWPSRGGGQDEYTGLTLNYLILPRWDIQHAGTFHRIADIRVNTHTHWNMHTLNTCLNCNTYMALRPTGDQEESLCLCRKRNPIAASSVSRTPQTNFTFTTKLKSGHLISLTLSEYAQKNWHCSQRKSLSLCITHPHSNALFFFCFTPHQLNFSVAAHSQEVLLIQSHSERRY